MVTMTPAQELFLDKLENLVGHKVIVSSKYFHMLAVLKFSMEPGTYVMTTDEVAVSLLLDDVKEVSTCMDSATSELK